MMSTHKENCVGVVEVRGKLTVEQKTQKRWYAIHTQTGAENRVRQALKTRAEIEGLGELIGEVFIPTEKVSEVKDGKKKISERKFFPGYLLVELQMNDKSWYLVKNTPGVSGFVGSGQKPLPLEDDDIQRLVRAHESQTTKPKPKVDF